MNGALLIHKHDQVSSFGVIELLQRQLFEQGLKRNDLPKLGHGGTLDPFATGLLVVLVGRAVKLARYFLGASKTYEGIIRFGETTIPGDPTESISEVSTYIPESIQSLQEMAHRFSLQPYLQIPPMHSAKKKNGKPLYELARLGLEVEREPKLCHLYEFKITEYQAPQARFRLKCSSGTYVRTLAQDFAKLLGSVALLESLTRTSSGVFNIENSWSIQQIIHSGKKWDDLPCWIPFDELLSGYSRAQATEDQRQALLQGKQDVLFSILKQVQAPLEPLGEKEDCVAIYCNEALIAVARKEQNTWGIERVFT